MNPTTMPARNPITAYESLELAMLLMNTGKRIADELNTTLKLPKKRRRYVLCSGGVKEALDSVLDGGIDIAQVRVRVSIPDYIAGAGFVPIGADPEFEAYGPEGDLVYGPNDLYALPPVLASAVKMEITELALDAALEKQRAMEGGAVVSVHPYLQASTPYSAQEHDMLTGYKAGGGPAEAIPEVVASMRLKAKLRETTTFEHQTFEDNAAAPRDFWHVRAILGGEVGATTTEWLQYGKLGDARAPMSDEVRKEQEERVFEQLWSDVCTALGLDEV